MNNKTPEMLRYYRNLHDKKQKEIAEVIGVTERTYCNYENGKREPDIDTLIKVADYFNISLDILTGRYEPKTKPIVKIGIKRTEPRFQPIQTIHKKAVVKGIKSGVPKK